MRLYAGARLRYWAAPSFVVGYQLVDQPVTWVWLS